MEGWKKWYIWIVAVFLLTAVAGKVIMARTPDVGLAGVKTIDELSGRQVKLEYALGDGESREALVESLTKNQDEYVRQAEDADIIVLAKSTGALEFTTGTYGQEICVSSIIKGNELIDENETCWIWRSYGMEVMDGQIVYRNVLNLMQDGTYLVFLNSNQLNAYRTEKEFQTASEYFGYLPIAGAEVQPIKENQRNVIYKEWSEIPVFISSKKVAAAWNEIAEMLLNKFEPDA